MTTPVISRVVLKIGGLEVSMTVDEAKELMRLLQDTFGEKEEKIRYIPYPVHDPPPVVIERDPWPYQPWRITWTSTAVPDQPYYGDTMNITYTNKTT